MALDSTATLAEKWAAYDDNASYREDRSVSKARAFVTACTLLLRVTPLMTTGHDGRIIQMDPRLIRGELERANKWLAANEPLASGATPGTVDFAQGGDFR